MKPPIHISYGMAKAGSTAGFQLASAARSIAAQPGVDAKCCARMARAAATGSTVAAPRRHEREMAAEDPARIGGEFAPFIER